MHNEKRIKQLESVIKSLSDALPYADGLAYYKDKQAIERMQEELAQLKADAIPHGYCQCGCGQKTKLAKLNDASKGWVKGEPLRFVRHHNTKINAQRKREQCLANKYLSTHGYVVINTGNGTRQYEHILKAEKSLGRPLKYYGPGHPDNEVVHHIDGDKQNNANSNLLICTHQYHVELHHKLEASPDWPQFKKIVRNPYGNKGRQGATHV